MVECLHQSTGVMENLGTVRHRLYECMYLYMYVLDLK